MRQNSPGEGLQRNQIIQRLTSLKHFEYLPCYRNGELLWIVATMFWVLFHIAIYYWMSICRTRAKIPDFEGEEGQPLFEPVALGPAGAPVIETIEATLAIMQQKVMPVLNTIFDLDDMFSKYFLLQTVVVALMLLR